MAPPAARMPAARYTSPHMLAGPCTRRGVLLALVGLFPSRGHAQAAAPIRVSYQPATYWSLPFLVAVERGFWAQEGLRPELIAYPHGAPQIDAGAKGAWDVGGLGSAPAVLGAARFGLLTIGITNDESFANAVMVRGDAAATWLRRPARDLRGKTVLLTPSSTGEYVLRAYLGRLRLDPKAVKIVHMEQRAIVHAFTAGKAGDVFVLWAPYLYVALSRGGKVLANGRSAGVTVPGALVAHPRFAREHPDLVARFLRVYVRSLEWQRTNRARALDMLARFSAEAGVKIDKRWLEEGFKTRPVWGVAGQLGLLSRRDGPSTADRWFSEIGEEFVEADALETNPDPTRYITDEYMKMAATGLPR
jgi:NitT/TauT family transport system substrate-binding protein